MNTLIRRPTLLTLMIVAIPLLVTAQGRRDETQRDEKKWDVTAALGPTSKLSFETDEGTWMNLDVSPDGKQIVFDLSRNRVQVATTRRIMRSTPSRASSSGSRSAAPSISVASSPT